MKRKRRDRLYTIFSKRINSTERYTRITQHAYKLSLCRVIWQDLVIRLILSGHEVAFRPVKS